jgi:2,6-dihydroxypyridine 3-monooxygenase
LSVSLRVAVIGGSLGGLTAGLLLRDLGHDVTILERSPAQLEQRGAGIGLLSETSRYLTERVGVALDDISISTEHIRHIDRAGRITDDHLHAYRFSSWNTIYRHLLKAFGVDRYLLNREVTQLNQHNDCVSVEITDRASIEADLVVCADGVGSRFRLDLLPETVPAYAGYVAWRGMVPERNLPPDVAAALSDAITYSLYANSHVLVYPIPGLDGSVVVGERLINFVWYRNYQAGADLNDLMTGDDGVRREVSLPPGVARRVQVDEMRATARARLPLVLSTVIAAAEAPFVQVVFDVGVDRMAFGRIVLLGDAAWVARPHAAAGTAKAADDAWALAESLVAYPESVVAAMVAYEARQLSVGRQLLDRTRRIGAQSQIENSWRADDPEHIFGLHAPGVSV